MEREFLKSLGLEKDVIDSIMREFGKDMSEKLGAINDLTSKNTELTTKLGGYTDYDDIKKQLEDVKTEYENFKSNSAVELEKSNGAINELKLSHAIDLAVEREHSRDIKAFMAHLDMSKISLNENNELVGFSDQASSIRENQPYLFEDNKPSGIEYGKLGSSAGKTLTMEDAIKEHYAK